MRLRVRLANGKVLWETDLLGLLYVEGMRGGIGGPAPGMALTCEVVSGSVTLVEHVVVPDPEDTVP